MRLLRKVGKFLDTAIAFCLLAAFSFMAACASGFIIVAIVNLFSHTLADMLRHSTVGLVVTGYLVILCGWLVWRARKRKLAIEEEIKNVSEIEIIKPQPGPVRKFVDRFVERLNHWSARFSPKWAAQLVGIVDKWKELPLAVRSVGYALASFLVGATVFWCQGTPLGSVDDRLIAAIVVTIIYGWVLIFVSVAAVTWLLFALFLPIALLEIVSEGLWRARTWLVRNLPRGLVWRYRSWQLRRAGRRLRCDAPQELAENVAKKGPSASYPSYLGANMNR